MNERTTIDPAHVDWPNVVATTYRIEQSFRYEYPEPIAHLHHRLVVSPRAVHADQRRVSHRLAVLPHAPVRVNEDAFGNDVLALHVPEVRDRIAFNFESVVRRDRRTPIRPETLSELDGRAYRSTRRLTRADDALADVAADLRRAHQDPLDRAEAVASFVFERMSYAKGVSDVATTAAESFAKRRGVCQDFAHVFISLARAGDLATRYVSGHLLGEGATHAWVEVLIADGAAHRVHSFDPTHGCKTDLRYVTVAVGRDYDDVAPTSGVYTGRAPGTLSAEQHVYVTDVKAA